MRVRLQASEILAVTKPACLQIFVPEFRGPSEPLVGGETACGCKKFTGNSWVSPVLEWAAFFSGPLHVFTYDSEVISGGGEMSGRLIDTFSAITEEGALDWPGLGCLGPRLGAHPLPGPPLPLPADSGSSQVLPLHGSQEPHHSLGTCPRVPPAPLPWRDWD